MTAENHRFTSPATSMAKCFNEAAADDRGKLSAARHARGPGARFNEAAADDRGKLDRRSPSASAVTRFNEAAADDRGKQEIDALREDLRGLLQ